MKKNHFLLLKKKKIPKVPSSESSSLSNENILCFAAVDTCYLVRK